MDVIDKILELMDKNHITAARLSDHIGVSKNAVSEWKKGRIKPSIEVIVKIARYFDVSTDYLLCLTDNPTLYDNNSTKDTSLLEAFHSLNNEGQEKVLGYTNDLISSGQYIKIDSARVVEKTKQA